MNPNSSGVLVPFGDRDIALEDEREEEAIEKARLEHRPPPLPRDHLYARGNCDTDKGCGDCERLDDELAHYDPAEVNWYCPSCIPSLCKRMKELGIQLTFPGHFKEGPCSSSTCDRAGMLEREEGMPGLLTGKIIQIGKRSRLTQLVIGPLRKE